MTVLVGLRTKDGAVLAADSRVTIGTEILSDSCSKLMRLGEIMVAVAGHDGGLMRAIEGCRTYEGLVAVAGKYGQDRPNLDWSLLVYNSTTHWLGGLYSDGLELTLGDVATDGSGGAVARGWLDAQTAQLKDLDNARTRAVSACRAAIKRDSACGGRVRSLVLKVV